jgi:hypothetical protein
LEPILDEYTMARGNIDTLLVKMLVQYGPMVCVDASNLSFEYLKEHFAFMCDPFTYRTAQQAPTVVKRFVVAKTHVDDLVVQVSAPSLSVSVSLSPPFLCVCIYPPPQ